MLFVDELQHVPLVDLNNQQVDCEWTPPPLPLPPNAYPPDQQHI